MGTIRGRAVLDFLRHRLSLAPTASYDRKDFWDRSYAKTVRPHEWGVKSADLMRYAFTDASPIGFGGGVASTSRLEDDCPKKGRTLLLGGGTSSLGGDLVKAGWTDVAAVDFSDVAVARGVATEPEVAWSLGDARDLEAFPAASLSAVLDKGTIDAIYMSAGANHEADVAAVAASAAGALQPKTGVLAVLSLTAPRYLWPLLFASAPHNWDVATSEVRRLDAIYLYLLRRGRASGGPAKRRRR